MAIAGGVSVLTWLDFCGMFLNRYSDSYRSLIFHEENFVLQFGEGYITVKEFSVRVGSWFELQELARILAPVG